MLLTDRTVPSRQTFFAFRRTADFRTIGSLGCVGCSIALCLSSQRNVISFSAHCVCHRSLSLLSSSLVAFVIFACRFYHRRLFCLVLFLSAVFLAPAFLWIFSFACSFV